MIKIEDIQTRPVVSVEEVVNVVDLPKGESVTIVAEPIQRTVEVIYRNDTSMSDFFSTLAVIAILLIVFGRSISIIGAIAGGALVMLTGAAGMLYLLLQAVL